MLYRVPSQLLVQVELLPEMDYTHAGRDFRVSGPTIDKRYSIQEPVIRVTQRAWFRFADVLPVGVSAAVPQTDILGEARERTYREVAPLLQQVAERLLASIRYEAGQWWLGHQVLPLNRIVHPIQYALLDDQGEMVEGRAFLGQPTFSPKTVLRDEMWSRIGDQMRRGADPPIEWVLWLDAAAFKDAGHLRSAVLSGAMACEVAVKTFIRDVPGAREPLYQYLVDRDRELSIFDFRGEVLGYATGSKAKDKLSAKIAEDTTAHDWIRRLFETSNKVAHEGRAYYRRGRQEIRVDNRAVEHFLSAASGLLRWMDSERRRPPAPEQAGV